MPTLSVKQRLETIREHNDRFRSRCGKPIYDALVAGKFVIDPSISTLTSDQQYELWQAILNFDDFDADPYNERNFGIITLVGNATAVWKIDYFADEHCTHGSENPANPKQTYRVMDIMLADVYEQQWASSAKIGQEGA